MSDFAGQAILITGAAGGVGTALAETFARSGANLVLSDINAEALSSLCHRLDAGTNRIRMEPADLSTRNGCRALAAACGDIDVLINNAALTHMRYQGVIVPDDAFWDKTFAIDFLAPITLMQALMPSMAERGHGVVLNITSVNASRGTIDLAPYAAAKAALEAASKVAAMEMAMRRTGVRVNCVAPGLVGTEALARNFRDPTSQAHAIAASVPLGRVVAPEEIAELCLYLATSAPPSLLGTVVTIDGGMTSGAYSFSGTVDRS